MSYSTPFACFYLFVLIPDPTLSLRAPCSMLLHSCVLPAHLDSSSGRVKPVRALPLASDEPGGLRGQAHGSHRRPVQRRQDELHPLPAQERLPRAASRPGAYHGQVTRLSCGGCRGSPFSRLSASPSVCVCLSHFCLSLSASVSLVHLSVCLYLPACLAVWLFHAIIGGGSPSGSRHALWVCSYFVGLPYICAQSFVPKPYPSSLFSCTAVKEVVRSCCGSVLPSHFHGMMFYVFGTPCARRRCWRHS